MRSYIDQFYNEGLATVFYLPVIRFINKHVKNELFRNFCVLVTRVLYTILVIVFAAVVFYYKWPL